MKTFTPREGVPQRFAKLNRASAEPRFPANQETQQKLESTRIRCPIDGQVAL
jgi:hypothetical protein